MEVNSIVRLRRAALLAGAFTALLAAAMPSLADNDRDDERCAGNKALRLVNGRIHTMDAKDRIVSSVLIRNGRFAAVGHGAHDGDDDCVREIDLRGRTAVPGIIDSHNHIILLGLRPGRDTRLEFANSIPEALATFTARAKEAKPGEWITAVGGFSRNQFFKDPQPVRFPTLDELTKAVPDHPVFMMEGFSGPGATPVISAIASSASACAWRAAIVVACASASYARDSSTSTCAASPAACRSRDCVTCCA